MAEPELWDKTEIVVAYVRADGTHDLCGSEDERPLLHLVQKHHEMEFAGIVTGTIEAACDRANREIKKRPFQCEAILATLPDFNLSENFDSFHYGADTEGDGPYTDVATYHIFVLPYDDWKDRT